MDRQQLWNPCMPQTTIINEKFERWIKITDQEREAIFIKMAQVDIVIQDIESKKPIHQMDKETKVAFAKYLWSHL